LSSLLHPPILCSEGLVACMLCQDPIPAPCPSQNLAQEHPDHGSSLWLSLAACQKV
jgi:hypothetical protein